MKQIIYPLKDNWKVKEDEGFVHDQREKRVQSEDWFTQCRGYPIIKNGDVKIKKK